MTELVQRNAPDNLRDPRAIVRRTSGNRRGPITRLISPGDLGQIVKPFVFLDLFEVERFEGRGFALSCPRFLWTPICLTGGRCGEVQDEQDQAK